MSDSRIYNDPPISLPAQRSRPITPPNSQPCIPQRDSPFFRLPPDIREEIMHCAFGHRTIHIESMLDHLMPGPASQAPSSHKAHNQFTSERDTSLPKRWVWRSSVCHRNAPWTPTQNVWWRFNWHKPDADRCMEGDAFACRPWLGDWPTKCSVGVLGWLLSCRQAYSECIDVIYATNIFHLTSKHLMCNLEEYLLPERLARMSAFEVIIPHSENADQYTWKPCMETLSSFLQLLSQRTCIKRLHLCLPDRDNRENIDWNMFQHIESAIDGFMLASKVECVILQIDPVLLTPFRKVAEMTHSEEREARSSGAGRELWRALDEATFATEQQEGSARRVVGGKTRHRACFYPEVLAPLKDPANPELGTSYGYWIMASTKEPPYVCNLS